MKKLFFAFILISVFGCSSKNIKKIEGHKAKELVIERNYSVIYCECEKNKPLVEVLEKFKKRGFQIISINSFEEMDTVNTGNNIVLYGYSKQMTGDKKEYTITNLVNRKETHDCGKGCRVYRRWNELVFNTVTTSGAARHDSVLVYKIDESTELLMALTSSDKYSLRLSTKEETGSNINTLSETKAYVIK